MTGKDSRGQDRAQAYHDAVSTDDQAARFWRCDLALEQWYQSE